MTGLLKTPASIMGFILIGFFILIAIFAPVIAPPVSKGSLQDPTRWLQLRTQADGIRMDKETCRTLPFW